jgi:putative ABC transport system substrate-binding protein
MVKRQAGALVVMPDPFFFARREQLVALAARYAVPTIYPARDFIEIGGLMSYGPNLLDLGPEAGTYAEKILRGAKPADLPVQQIIKLELLINQKTAKALGLTIPPTLLALANEVIE